MGLHLVAGQEMQLRPGPLSRKSISLVETFPIKEETLYLSGTPGWNLEILETRHGCIERGTKESGFIEARFLTRSRPVHAHALYAR